MAIYGDEKHNHNMEMHELNDREHDHGPEWYRKIDSLIENLESANETRRIQIDWLQKSKNDLWDKIWELERRIENIKEANDLYEGN